MYQEYAHDKAKHHEKSLDPKRWESLVYGNADVHPNSHIGPKEDRFDNVKFTRQTTDGDEAAIEEHLFGKAMSNKEYGDLIGIGGAKGVASHANVSITHTEDHRRGKMTTVYMVGFNQEESYQPERSRLKRNFFKDGDGNLVCENQQFFIKNDEDKGKGVGTRTLAQQVLACRKIGVNHIETSAAGQGPGHLQDAMAGGGSDDDYGGSDDDYGGSDDDYWGIPDSNDDYLPPEATQTTEENGYYTWALLGYDGVASDEITNDLKKEMRKKQSGDLAKILGKYNSDKGVMVSDYMQSDDGRAFWKKYGQEFDGCFPLFDDSSRSFDVLNEYITKKAKSKDAKSADHYVWDH